MAFGIGNWPNSHNIQFLLQHDSRNIRLIPRNFPRRRYFRTARATFYMPLQFSGGTIGLFLGASLVSFIEAAFWIYRVTESRPSIYEAINSFLIDFQGIKRLLGNILSPSKVSPE